MKKTLAIFLFFVCCYSTTGDARGELIEGVIFGYACGDNCYLTVTDENGKNYTGLCAAPVCQEWNEMETGMPSKFKGKKVKVTVGRGLQYYGDGGVAGETDSFDKIDLMK